MKQTVIVVIIAVLLIAGASMTGIVGFHYPKVIQNEPLRNPQKVVRVDGTNIFLHNGTVIAVDLMNASDINKKLSQSAFQIDVEGGKDGPVAIWARQDGGICGTPWAQPIRIPLIADIVYKNRRELIAFGTYVNSNSQQNASNRIEVPGAAILPEAHRSERNTMNADSQWALVGVVPDGQSFTIDGVDVWKNEWIDTKERVHVEDPLYHQQFIFHVYEIRTSDKVVRFAAGEFSNCMWGFYAKH